MDRIDEFVEFIKSSIYVDVRSKFEVEEATGFLEKIDVAAQKFKSEMIENKSETDVDFVEVVRCKYCKHYKGEQNNCWLMRSKMKPNDFCSYGERSEK